VSATLLASDLEKYMQSSLKLFGVIALDLITFRRTTQNDPTHDLNVT